MTFAQAPGVRALLGLGVVVAGLAMAGPAWGGPSPVPAPKVGTILGVGTDAVVPNSYVVIFKESKVRRDAVTNTAKELANRYGGTPGRVYSNAVRGFEVSLSEAAAARLAADTSVAFVQRNGIHAADGIQTPTPSWGLDRVDQRVLPLDNRYTYPNTASLIKAYIIDTGIRFTHTDFGGRAVSGFDAIDGGPATDGNGHGTHVAGTVGGLAYGIAKDVTLVGVRVLNNLGSGTSAQVIAGIDWVTGDHLAGQPAVANMSLGGGIDVALDSAVANSIADGVTYGVAAGNSSTNACTTSPARTPNAITVGATASNDARSSFSNFGTCLDIFAPGTNIRSDWLTSDTATNTISGTSMATPHVVGAAALVLKQFPTLTPQQVRDYLVTNATAGVVANAGTGSPNKLLYVVNPTVANDFSVTATPAAGSVGQGQSITTTISTAAVGGVSRAITLSASGLPAGATAQFTPASLMTGASSSLVLGTGPSTPVGMYPITISGTGTNPTLVRTATYLLTVTGSGCSATNPTDVLITDFATVESSVVISGCPGSAAAASRVTVDIIHTFIGDLVVSLIAPDGTAYTLHNRSGGSADNIRQTYTVNLSSELANGTWKLRVSDNAGADTGYLNSWGVVLSGSSAGCTATNGTDVVIPDLATVESTIVVAGCTGNASASSTVEVHIVHTYSGDLVVSLVAPDGSVYVLRNRAGGSADNIDQTFTVNLSSEVRNGAWRLRVRDAASADVGFINSWTLAL